MCFIKGQADGSSKQQGELPSLSGRIAASKFTDKDARTCILNLKWIFD
jgi:hypothetical protein